MKFSELPREVQKASIQKYIDILFDESQEPVWEGDECPVCFYLKMRCRKCPLVNDFWCIYGIENQSKLWADERSPEWLANCRDFVIWMLLEMEPK